MHSRTYTTTTHILNFSLTHVSSHKHTHTHIPTQECTQPRPHPLSFSCVTWLLHMCDMTPPNVTCVMLHIWKPRCRIYEWTTSHSCEHTILTHSYHIYEFTWVRRGSCDSLIYTTHHIDSPISHIWVHMSATWFTWLTHIYNTPYWLTHITYMSSHECDVVHVTHSYIQHTILTHSYRIYKWVTLHSPSATWLTLTCNLICSQGWVMTHSYVRYRGMHICVTWLMSRAGSWVRRRDSLICETWCVHRSETWLLVCAALRHVYVWHDSCHDVHVWHDSCNDAQHTYECIISHIHDSLRPSARHASCYTYASMSHIRVCHVLLMWIRHVAHMSESCLTHEPAGDLKKTNASCRTYTWVACHSRTGTWRQPTFSPYVRRDSFIRVTWLIQSPLYVLHDSVRVKPARDVFKINIYIYIYIFICMLYIYIHINASCCTYAWVTSQSRTGAWRQLPWHQAPLHWDK